MKSTLREFLRLESSSGILLMAAAALAMIAANSPLKPWYDLHLALPVEIRIGTLEIAKPLVLWINDGLMAVFFFVVGLELKREILQGELSRLSNVMLPAIGAIGGMVFPVMIYMIANQDDASAFKGWAIPAATDIAFALGILMLLGKRVPVSLKVFLVSLAIFDDIGAVIIIAIFYTSKLATHSLIIAGVCLIVLSLMSWRRVSSISPFLWVGLILWTAVLKSGVHATLAGVALAMFIPMTDKDDPDRSPLRELEHDLHGLVAFVILPIFAFANAGVSLRGIGLEDLLHPVPLGIAAGLVIGKLFGVFLLCWLAIVSGIARLPDGAGWGSLAGVAALCGVGFTMSLFIGSLAFESSGTAMTTIYDERLGILVGSLISGLLGYFILNRTLPRTNAEDP
jgi:NhaA family Na+:H+ antiporter